MSNAVDKDSLILSEGIRLEKQIIAMMLKYPAILPDIEKNDVLNYFEDKSLVVIGKMIIHYASSGDGDISLLMSHIQDDEQRSLVAALSISHEQWDHKACDNLLWQFLNSKKKYNTLLNQIKAAEDSDNQELLFKLLKEKQKQAAKQH